MVAMLHAIEEHKGGSVYIIVDSYAYTPDTLTATSLRLSAFTDTSILGPIEGTDLASTPQTMARPGATFSSPEGIGATPISSGTVMPITETSVPADGTVEDIAQPVISR